jgi:hypothetical protein
VLRDAQIREYREDGFVVVPDVLAPCGGPWKSCVLWAPGGDRGDGLVTTYAYDQRPAFTEYGNQLPYLQELITNTVDVARLNFERCPHHPAVAGLHDRGVRARQAAPARGSPPLDAPQLRPDDVVYRDSVRLDQCR